MADPRVLADTSAYPYNAIGWEDDRAADGTVFNPGGTVFVVDSRHLLTAGHVLYDASHGGLSASMNIHLPNGQVIAATNLRVSPQYQANGDFTRDYGLITVGQDLPVTPIAIANVGVSVGTAVSTAGYPVDLASRGGVEYREAGSVTGSFLQYLQSSNLVGFAGQSGGPVWVSLNGTPTAVGIETRGDTTGITAVRLDQSAIDQIHAWEQADGTYTPPAVPGQIATPVASVNYRAGVDNVYYAANNADVAASGIDLAAHYHAFGWKEGRNPDALFNTAYYLANNPDVKAAGIDPLQHYELYGWKEGRQPSAAFNTAEYLALNPDVKAAGLNPLDHYLLFGAAEHRAV